MGDTDYEERRSREEDKLAAAALPCTGAAAASVCVCTYYIACKRINQCTDNDVQVFFICAAMLHRCMNDAGQRDKKMSYNERRFCHQPCTQCVNFSNNIVSH